MRKTTLALILLVIMPAASAQVYKCTDAAGKVTFSQMPCATNAQAVDADIHQPTPDEITARQQLSGSMQQAVDEGIDRRREARQQAALQRGEAARIRQIQALQAARDRELAAIRAKSARANNNLPGAVYSGALAREAQAITERYNADIELLGR